MAIFRGTGGAGEANDDATLNAVTEQALDAANSATDAASSATAAAASATSIQTMTAATGAAGTEASWDSDTNTLTVPRGDTGATGAAGTDGTDGLGFTGGSYNSSTGVVTFTSDDGLGFSTTDVRGADGTDGIDGTNGTNGTNGTDGLGWTGGSYSAVTGIVTFTSDDGLGFTTGDLRGADGTNGTDGIDGTNGTNGTDGLGWTGGSYNASTGVVTFTSDDGLGFTTGDLRGADGEGDLLSTNNLSDLTNAATARTNLGLGTAATTASTDYVATTGDSMTGNLTFGDNDKAIFGAGSDLQIYHDGSHSYIKDAGDGQLRLLAGTNVQIWNADATKMAANFNGDTQADLRYAGNIKLATTSTGVSVTGTVAATSYTGDGSNLTGINALPTQTGYSGKFLTTDGTNASWADTGASAGMFWENDQTLTSDYTITSSKNAGTFGPVTIDTGVSVTVPTGSTWTIV